MSATLSPGALFAGRYRIVSELAAGGMGAVYEVVHVETERRRALKVIHPHLLQSDEMRERFKREIRIAAQLESEHVVDVVDAGVDEATKTPFLVMELLRGEDLGARLHRLGRLPAEEVVTYLQQAAIALDRTHAKGIVHRDLKPRNLFLARREDGATVLKVLDFGIAKVVREGATGSGATQILGTPAYMAPEQLRLGGKLTPATDVYALGMMTYTLLVGQAYWAWEAHSSGDVLAFAMEAVRGPEEPATRRAAACGIELPASFDRWFATATAVSPSARYQSATAAVQALGEALGTRACGPAARAATLVSGFESTAPISETAPAAHAPDVATSTGPLVSRAPQRRSGRGALVAWAVALGLALLWVAVWLGLRIAARGAPPLGEPSAAASLDGTVAPAIPAAAEAAPPSALAAAQKAPKPPAELPATSTSVSAAARAAPAPRTASRSVSVATSSMPVSPPSAPSATSSAEGAPSSPPAGAQTEIPTRE
jgi:serine/threonine-protein kinase